MAVGEWVITNNLPQFTVIAAETVL
jgi:hypothetical protein